MLNAGTCWLKVITVNLKGIMMKLRRKFEIIIRKTKSKNLDTEMETERPVNHDRDFSSPPPHPPAFHQ